jgi:hypothetical protein
MGQASDKRLWWNGTYGGRAALVHGREDVMILELPRAQEVHQRERDLTCAQEVLTSRERGVG